MAMNGANWAGYSMLAEQRASDRQEHIRQQQLLAESGTQVSFAV